MQPPKILPPHYFLLSIFSMAIVTFLSGRGLFDNIVVYAGLLPMLAGLLLATGASSQFKKADTDIIPLSKSTTLVTDGMFRWSRNPMYLGMMLFLAGLALVLDNLWNWLVVLVFVGIIRQWFVLREEPLMLETFGADYAAYQQRVRRWL